MAFFEGAYHKRLPSVDPETGAILKIEGAATAAQTADGRAVGDCGCNGRKEAACTSDCR